MSSVSQMKSSVFVFEPSSSSACTVTVTDIPLHVDINEILSIFAALVGNVVAFKKVETKSGTELEVQLADEQTVQKALSLSGYPLDGIQITITKAAGLNKRPSDDRKNLYVLGLPFSLTKTEFAALFSQYGMVTHSVILATVDNSSRRRGFVVMGSHEEAKLAMKSLSRSQIKGHTLDISWAVVQRSQGFLDGGDRAMVLDGRPGSGSMTSAQKENSDIISCGASLPSNGHELACLAPSPDPTATLLVTDLPMFLFNEEKDMHPLLCPFGRINKMRVIKSVSKPCTSVVVEFESPKLAQDAKENIQGQWYSGYQIAAQFVREVKPFPNSPSFPAGYSFTGPNSNNQDASSCSSYSASLNAAPSFHAFPHQPSSYNAQAELTLSRRSRACNLDAPAAIYSSRHHRRNPYLLHH